VVFQRRLAYLLAQIAIKINNLPPILHKKKFITLHSCSKGARGLSV